MVYAVMEVGDLAGRRFVPFRGMVDTGSTYTTLPARLLTSLGLSSMGDDAEVELADGRYISRRWCYALVRFEGEAVELPVLFDDDDKQVLIGATTLEALRLVVDPVNNRLASVARLT